MTDLFAADPDAAVLRVLQESGAPMTAVEIKKTLTGAGVDKAAVDRAWPPTQKRIKAHEQVIFAGTRYAWADEPDVTAAEALDLLLNGKLDPEKRAALAEKVRAALADAGAAPEPSPDPPAAPSPDAAVSPAHAAKGGGAAKSGAADSGQAPDSGSGADSGEPALETAARQRQTAIDGVRQLAELASEIEELIANETEPAVMIRQVRAWVKRSSLDPVGQAGEEVKFDRKIHKPIGGRISDGAKVIVVRPGYVWKTPDEELLIGKAVVEE